MEKQAIKALEVLEAIGLTSKVSVSERALHVIISDNNGSVATLRFAIDSCLSTIFIGWDSPEIISELVPVLADIARCDLGW